MSEEDLAKENLGIALIIVAWVFAAIAIVIVATRYYVRMRIVRKIHVDDWLILITLASPASKQYIVSTDMLMLPSSVSPLVTAHFAPLLLTGAWGGTSSSSHQSRYFTQQNGYIFARCSLLWPLVLAAYLSPSFCWD